MFKRFRRGEKGQAMVEFVLVFPVQLLFTLGIMQLCLIFIGKQMTEYAAFRAARARLVSTSQARVDRAAQIALAPVSISVNGNGGRIRGLANSQRKVRTEVRAANDKYVDVIVINDYELIIPAIREVFVHGGKFLFIGDDTRRNPRATQHDGLPHLELSGRAIIPRTWSDR